MYAIVDIETTGSFAHSNGITEIAIVLHNGEEVEGSYETLVNPRVPIPKYVASLTGISNQMVQDAPDFSVVAPRIYQLLNNRIFIAHNVNFDYSFIKYHLKQSGIEWNARKLCTQRLTRKSFPQLKKYGLENVCRELNINNENRHRAGGDARATAVLFDMILRQDGTALIKDFLKKENQEQLLPPNLSHDQVSCLPERPGVYYFHDAANKVIYVGKAKSLKKRVISHFTGLDISKKRQDFLKHIHSVTYQECATEFTASIFESIEIKRLWPAFNYSQKRPEQLFGIYFFEDAKGYFRLAIDKKRKNLPALILFNLMNDAYRMLWKLVKDFELDPVLCFLDKTDMPAQTNPLTYNIKVQKALEWLESQKQTFLLCDKENERINHILVEQGRFYGMGLVNETPDTMSIENIKTQLTPYPENEVIHAMIRNYVEKYPWRIKRIL